MPLTYTGRLVRPGGLEHPSLIDIAVSLSRQPRFGGHCRRWWSVLDHTLFCDELVKADGSYTSRRKLRLAMLIHDAHEAVTADVPTDVKTEDFRAQQRILDVVIQDAFFPGGRAAYVGNWDLEDTVHGVDRRALCAEAQFVGPPAEARRILELFGVCEETVEDVNLLKILYHNGTGLWGTPPYGWDQGSHPMVQEYLKRMTEVL